MNTQLINELSPVDKVIGIYATLVDELNKTVYSFLFNPEEKTFSRSAFYSEGVTALTSLPSQQYKYTTGLTLTLDNLLLESYSRGRSCKSIMQDLQKLMVANPAALKYAPTPVYFKWGKDEFGPAVITDLKWKETQWLNGEVATARVSFTLLEIPESQLPRKAKEETSQNKLKAALKSSNKLTDRQKEEAISKAKGWLKQNINKFSDNISSLIRINKYKLSVSDNGTVSLFNQKNVLLGTVGTYKDGKLNTSNNNLSRVNI
ncbi:hypothetical protein NIES22_50870 [Calothrix brevissima NIES-22]|nr:hypothetical protein NIES22_50870 [Calothrix brevissima NIES-22]